MVGCSGGSAEDQEQEKGPEQSSDAPVDLTAQELEWLRSLSYVSWTDDDADASRSGVMRHDPGTAFFGYNLFTNDTDTIHLMDMSGRVLHSWHIPGGRHCEYAEILPRGELIAVCVGQWLVRLDWDSKIMWKVDGMVHHDVAVVGGAFHVPFSERHHEYQGRKVKFDGLLKVSSGGKILDKWRVVDRLKEIQPLHEATELDTPPSLESGGLERAKKEKYDYYHLNTVEVLEETELGRRDSRFRPGNILLCLRNADLVIILDGDTHKVVWHWGPGVLDYPHMPTLLENGHLLVFDNGVHRDFSRVLEVNPVTEEIVWQYRAADFYSQWRGSNQRLPNGNTLICESQNGRVFEVTPAGEVVWEFHNPEMKRKKRKRIYRMMRYSPEQMDALLGGRFRIGP